MIVSLKEKRRNFENLQIGKNLKIRETNLVDGAEGLVADEVALADGLDVLDGERAAEPRVTR
jgi:hypothetical protein